MTEKTTIIRQVLDFYIIEMPDLSYVVAKSSDGSDFVSGHKTLRSAEADLLDRLEEDYRSIKDEDLYNITNIAEMMSGWSDEKWTRKKASVYYNRGQFPKPDAYLVSKSPLWEEENIWHNFAEARIEQRKEEQK